MSVGNTEKRYPPGLQNNFIASVLCKYYLCDNIFHNRLANCGSVNGQCGYCSTGIEL